MACAVALLAGAFAAHEAFGARSVETLAFQQAFAVFAAGALLTAALAFWPRPRGTASRRRPLRRSHVVVRFGKP